MNVARLAAVFGAFVLLFVGYMTPITVLISPQSLEHTGLSIGRIEGHWLNAELSNVTWRGYTIGDVAFEPVLSALFTGLILFNVRSSRGNAQFDGFVGRSLFSSLQVRDMHISADLAGLPVLIQVAGRLNADIQDFEYSSKGCRRAVGTLETDALTRGIAGLPWAGPVMTGQLQCTDGAIVLPLSSNTEGQRVSAVMSLKPNGTFDARIDIASVDPGIAQVLPQLGFRQEGDSLVLEQTGRWSK